MTTSKLTSKGQTTIPREIRERLGLKPGSRIVYSMDGDGVVQLRRQPSLMDLAGALRGGRSGRGMSFAQIRAAAARAAVRAGREEW